MEKLRQELSSAYEIIDAALDQYAKLHDKWKYQETQYLNLNCDLTNENKGLNGQVQELKLQVQELQTKHGGCDGKITALRNIARALESENQLLTGEKEHLENFKNTFCKENGALK